VGVERGHRLVQEQDRGVARERAGQRDALPLATRELRRPRPREVPDAEPVEQLSRARAPAEADVRLDGEVREKRVVLEDEPDAALLRWQVDASCLIERLAVEDDPPLRGLHEPGDRVQHGRLPCPGRPDERERLAPDLERYLELEGAKRMGEVEL
jgi:hypothetical protein